MTSSSFPSFPLDDQVFSTDYDPGGGNVPVDGLVSDSPDKNYGFEDHESRSPYGSVNVENGNSGGLFNDDGFFVTDGPILPPPGQMELEEGFALREWRRQNAILLEQKEVREKELRIQIILDGEDFVKDFYEKRKLNVETNKKTNREREKSFLLNQEKFHKEADKQFWKAIGDLIPNEVPNFEKRRGKKELENKPSITVVQGPKPGKSTDLSRMRHILVKLKHTPPPHMIPPPTLPAKDAKDGKDAMEKANGTAAAGRQKGSPPKDAVVNNVSSPSEMEAALPDHAEPVNA